MLQGDSQTQLQPGDEVFGDVSSCGFGAFAEYASVPENQHRYREALALPTPAIEYYASQYLAENFPAKALIEGNDRLFNIETYAQVGHCSLEMPSFVHVMLPRSRKAREYREDKNIFFRNFFVCL